MDRHIKPQALIKKSLAILAMSTALWVASPVLSADLNPAPVVEGDTVRLGDLFDDAGEAAGVVIAQAPAPGDKLYFSAYELENIAKTNGIDWERPRKTTRVIIKRSGKLISKQEVSELVQNALVEQKGHEKFTLSTFGSSNDLFIPSFMDLSDIEIETVSLDDRTGRFSVWLKVPDGDQTKSRLEIRGKTEDLATVPVLRAAVTAGDVITEDDINWIDIPARMVTNSIVLSAEAMIGKSPRRTMRSGKPLRSSDLQAPVMIEKGAGVKMIVRVGNLSITSLGKALEDGGEGDLIRVMSLANKKTLNAFIIREGLVEIPTNSRISLVSNSGR